MMNEISRDQAHAVANLVHLLRDDDWDVQGIVSALGKARDRGNAFDVAHAALYAAADPSNRTPAVIAMPGPHWVKGRELGSSPLHFARCEIHPSWPITNCAGCIADRNAADDDTTTAAQTTGNGISKARIAEIFHTQGVTR